MDIMNVAALSTNLSALKTGSEIGMKVLGMSLDTANEMAASQVAALSSMPGPALEHSVNPAVGGNIDYSV